MIKTTDDVVKFLELIELAQLNKKDWEKALKEDYDADTKHDIHKESDNEEDPYFVFDTKEQRNRVTLIKMGWKPPTSLPSDDIVKHLN
jgi:hypothetical protein